MSVEEIVVVFRIPLFYVSYIYKQKLNLQVGMPESKLLMQLRTEGLRPYLMGKMLAGTKSCRLLEKVL